MTIRLPTPMIVLRGAKMVIGARIVLQRVQPTARKLTALARGTVSHAQHAFRRWVITQVQINMTGRDFARMDTTTKHVAALAQLTARGLGAVLKDTVSIPLIGCPWVTLEPPPTLQLILRFGALMAITPMIVPKVALRPAPRRAAPMVLATCAGALRGQTTTIV